MPDHIQPNEAALITHKILEVLNPVTGNAAIEDGEQDNLRKLLWEPEQNLTNEQLHYRPRNRQFFQLNNNDDGRFLIQTLCYAKTLSMLAKHLEEQEPIKEHSKKTKSLMTLTLF